MDNNVLVVIPSLNPDDKLKKTVSGLLEIGFSKIIIINDGSDNKHLDNFPESDNNISVIHRRQNHGKGAALKVAFRHILKNYPDCSGAVTVDADGQHKPEDVLNCAEALERYRNKVILGCRDFSGDDVPKKSRMGNHITSFVFKTICGMNISDTQTGLRAFPMSVIPKMISIKGDRYDYETNMLIKFKQMGVSIKEVPIETVYIEENSSSHFRPFVDSVRIYKFLLYYMLISVISFVVDISIFYICFKTFKPLIGKHTVLFSTVIARVISSLLNYNLNRTHVFDSKARKRQTMLRYYILAIPQMLVSAGLVNIISNLLGSTPKIGTIVKVIVDILLFFISYRIQQGWVFKEMKTRKKRKYRKRLTAKAIVGRSFLSLGTAVAMLLITVISTCLMICYGPSKSLRNMTVIMAKEASATKWIPTLFLPSKTVNQIIKDSEKINTGTINVSNLDKTIEKGKWDDSVNGTKLIFLNKPGFKGYLLMVKDPKRVTVGVSSENYSSATEGMRIFDIIKKYNCTAAINGGEFADAGGQGKGATPMGITYSMGKNVWNDGYKRTFIGFDSEDNMICRESMTKQEADKLKIRDAVSFQTGNVLIQKTGDDVKIFKADNDTGAAQRTAIGQCNDKSIILLVTDGRTVDSIGATRNDVIDIMLSYGVVNAGMLDGGSSAMMYYKDYANLFSVDKNNLDSFQSQGFVNKYKAFTKPRRIPTYFIVSEEK